MSNIAFCADLHAHNHGDFAKTIVVEGRKINSRLHDILDTLWTTAQRASRKGCNRFVVLGDIFHIRGEIPTDVMQYTYDVFSRINSELHMSVILLTGNHDQADKKGEVHAIHSFQDIATVVSIPLTLSFKDVDLYMIPYMDDHEDLVHALDSFAEAATKSTKPKILCMHAGIDGSLIGGAEYRIKDPLTIKDLHPKLYNAVLLGHYHKPQSLSKTVHYVGSPVQLTRAESEDVKRWIMWDTEEHKCFSIRTRAKQFYSVHSSELEALTPQPGYYDVIVDDAQTPTQIREYFDETCAVKITQVKHQARKKARIKVDGKTTDEKLLKRYLKHMGADPKLLTPGLRFLSQATNQQAAKTRLKFLQLTVSNFLSIENAELNLDRPGDVIALIGQNDDADGFESNGAGKSALLPESIYWALFGETARSLPADDVVNNIKKRDCCVTLDLQCDETEVTVCRFRKHKELGTGLKVLVDGKDISQGNVKDTEKLLWQLLGLDYTTFSSVVAFSPANLQFVSSTDANQKQVLDSILHTSRFSSALDLVKAALKDSKTSRQELINERSSLEGTLESHRTNLVEYETESDAYKEKEKQARKDLQESIAQKQRELEDNQQGVEETVEQIKQATAERDAVEIPDDTELQRQMTILNTGSGAVRADLKNLERRLAEINKELDEVTEQAGKPCPKCGQVVNNTAHLMAKLSSERAQLTSKQESLWKKQNDIEIVTAKVQSGLQAYHKAVGLQKDLDDKVRKLTTNRNSYQSRVLQVTVSLQGLRQSLKDRPSNVYAETLIPKVKQSIANCEIGLKTLATNIEAFDTEIAEYEFWVNGFGNAGVKSFLFDQIIPELTEYANFYLEQLAGDSIQVDFSTTSQAGKEKFTIKAMNSAGSDVYAGNSSGEKRRIDLAVMLALFRVANNRVSLSLLLADEVFDTLDSMGIENVVHILEEMARELELTIFVTSHSNLSNMLHESITIRKAGGLANIQD